MRAPFCLLGVFCLLCACNPRNPETNVPDATIVNGAAAPPSGHAHPENIPDTLHIEESDTAVHKR